MITRPAYLTTISNTLKTILLSFIVLFLASEVKATHLVGGDLTYKYEGQFNGLHRYRIRIEIFRDCYNSQTPFDNTIDVGVYYNEPNSKNIYDVLTISLGSETAVNPLDAGSNCAFKPNVCIKKGVYEKTIDLPSSNYGYHLVHIRCCRNNLTNVFNEEGQTYYGFIPATNLRNSSPRFNDVPAPYICGRDTIKMLNTTTDADGDSLVYKIVHPYAGGDKNKPAPAPPTFYSTLPLVKYNNGYSFSNPFGTGGLTQIELNTGLTTLYIPNVGLYAIAIDVEEYRNGVMISKTRRDIQLIVIPCNPSPTPYRTAGPNSTTRLNKFSYTIEAGEELSFDLSYAGGDTLRLKASGEMFNQGFINPPTLSNPTPDKIVSANFKWKPNCDQFRSNPYIFTVFAYNTNCPPKYVYDNYTIFVTPFIGADLITAPDTACQGQSIVVSTNGKTTNRHIWIVNGATYPPGNYNDKITLQLSKTETKATIKVVEVSANGCYGDTITKNIFLLPPPPPNSVSGKINVCPDEIATYTVAKPQVASIYLWTVTGGALQGAGNTGISRNIKWGKSQDTGFIKVVEINAKGCAGDTLYFKVPISIPKTSELFGTLSVCPNARGILYWVNPTKGSTYSWKTEGGAIAQHLGASQITVNWGNKGNGVVKVIEKTNFGCLGDTLSLKVTKDYALITPPISGDTSICAFSKLNRYSVPLTNNSKYQWTVSGGTIAAGQGTNVIFIDWDTSGKGVIQVLETAYDSVNNQPCIGKPVILTVTINPLPVLREIIGSFFLCQNQFNSYKVKGLNGSKFKWKFSGIDTFQKKNDSDYVTIAHRNPGTYTLTVYEISKDSCISDPITATITVYPIPLTSEIKGLDLVCAPNFNGLVYKVDSHANSTYAWKIAGGKIITSNTLPTITVDWLQPGVCDLYLQETSDKGCKSAERNLLVKFDSLHIDLLNVTTLKENQEVIELKWKTKNTKFLTTPLAVYRKSEEATSFQKIGLVDFKDGKYYDSKALTQKESYQYLIEYYNLCGDRYLTQTHKSILLNGYTPPDDTFIYLSWNEYQGWNPSKYSILSRKDKETDYTLLFDNKIDVLERRMEISDEGFKQCFRILAHEENFPKDSLYSYSNEVCFSFDPKIWIPSAFSPDANGVNDFFRVVATNYKSFSLKIFNRWGERIFESDSHKNMWDGTYRGEKSPLGVYLYILAVEGEKDTYFRQGTFHLLR